MLSVLAAEFGSIWPNLSELTLGYMMGGEDKPTPEELRTYLGQFVSICKKVGWNDLANQAQRLLVRAQAGEEGAGMEALTADLREAFQEKTAESYLAIIEQKD